MTRLTVRQLWAHKLRFVLTGLAVVLGVAFMSGTTILTDTMNRTFDELFVTANSDVDVVIQQPVTLESEWGEVRDRLPAEVLDTVRRVEGVGSAAGSVEGFAQLVLADGTVASTDGLGMTIGANWVTEDLSPFELAEGRAPEGAIEAVLDVATAEREGWALGDTFSVLTEQGPTDLTLVGTVTLGEIEGLPGSSLVATDDPTAMVLFGDPGHYDAVLVEVADDIDPAALAARIDDALGASGYEVITGAEDTENQQDSFHEDMAFFTQFLLAFAFISLFVGVFIIYNTFSIVVAQRRRDMAMLRAIGAGRGQLLRSVLLESVLVGVIASAIGLIGGVGMSAGLRALLGAVGLEIPDGELVISTSTIVTAFVVGLAVTTASAVGPALRAGRVAPIAALRDVSADRSGHSKARLVAGLLVTSAGAGAFAAGVIGDGDSTLPLLGLGSVTVVAGVFVLGPLIARPVIAVLGAPLPAVAGTVGRLARENARRNPRRTSATAAALMVGVALVGFITILAASTKESVTAAVDRSLRADFVVESGAWGDGGFGVERGAALDDLEEVAAMSPLRTTPAAIDDRVGEIHAVDTSTFDDMFDLGITDGDLASVTEGTVAVRNAEAATEGIALGDRLDVEFPTGAAVLEVAALFDEEIVGTGSSDYVVDLSTYEAHVADQFDRKVFLELGDGVSASQAATAIDGVVADQPNAEVQDQASFKEGITSQIDQMLNLVYGLLGLAIVIALIGIANTLALSVHERTRELGLLRAVGMTRRQMRTTIRWESVLIALLGTGLGAVLAVASAWGIVEALGTEGVTSFAIPSTQMAVIVGLAAFAGMVAALGPARRAARLNVLEAIATA